MRSILAPLLPTLRRLARSPMFTAVSLLTLAIGIGANTAIFSIIEGVLLKPLPHPDPEQLIALWHSAPGVNMTDLNMSQSLYFTYREEGRVFEDVTLWRSGTVSITGLAEPEEVRSIRATHRFLPLLKVPPALGRAFGPNDDDTKSPKTVMLADGYWRSRFGADPNVLGRRIMADGDAYEVIGVLPKSFQFMDERVSLLLPLPVNRAEVFLAGFNYQGVARLKPGVTMEQARADVARLLKLDVQRFPPPPGFSLKMIEDARLTPNLRTLKDDLLGDVGKTLWVLMGTVGLVLLIACANISNLLLVRADGRQHELAVRAALGAGWGRIASELLLESMALGLAGGALGVGVAYGALQTLLASGFAQLPRMDQISLDPWALAFSMAISLLSGLIFGLVPVLKYARPKLVNALRGGRSASSSRERHRARNLLVVVQVALALVLLISSGLMIRSVQALRNVDPGFSGAGQLQTVRIYLPPSHVKDPEQVIRVQQRMAGRVASIAGVSSVGLVDNLPMVNGSNDPVYAQDKQYQPDSIPPIRRYKHVSPGYFATAGSRLLAGRDMTWAETYKRIPVCLVSGNMAYELWGSPQNALGKRIRPGPNSDWFEVVGVVADLRDNGVDQKAPSIVYWPLLVNNFQGSPVSVRRSVAFLIRTPRAGSAGFQGELQRAIWSENANLPLANMQTLGAVYDKSLARASFTMALLTIAGAMALLLGVIGIYGVISYSVSQRSREIGIRLALGAPLPSVTGMFVRDGLVLSATGAVCGLAAAWALTRLMQSLLYEVSPGDPLTYGAVSLGLIAAAALASYLPARKASKVDPMIALRAE